MVDSWSILPNLSICLHFNPCPGVLSFHLETHSLFFCLPWNTGHSGLTTPGSHPVLSPAGLDIWRSGPLLMFAIVKNKSCDVSGALWWGWVVGTGAHGNGRELSWGQEIWVSVSRFFFGSIGTWTQPHTTRQVLYHLSHSTSPSPCL
jgi:hypothetical protein